VENIQDIKLTPRFLEIIENTYNDLRTQYNQEDLYFLTHILDKKFINVLHAKDLYDLIESRKNNIKFIKKNQDRKTFKIINKEHKYLEYFLNKYFKVNDFFISRKF